MKKRRAHAQAGTFFHLKYLAFQSFFNGDILFKNSVSIQNAVA
jgi:hypothetical protein